MPELSLSQASKLTGKSKSTINRYIKTGRLRATRREDGTYSIDPSELSRVFHVEPHETIKWSAEELPNNDIRTAVLEAELSAAKEALERCQETIADLRQDRDAWRTQATALLTNGDKRRSWWPWSNRSN